MKAKLFAFIGLAIAAIGTSLIFGSTTVRAAGESYRWINQNTIEASGGAYEYINAADDGVIRFTRGDDFTITSEGGCDITITISPSPSNRFGTLNSQGCEDNPQNTFDIEFEIGNPQNGPPIPGSDIDFTELDCSSFVEVPGTGEDFSQQRNRCEAMQACIASGDTQSNCLIIWQTCVDERNNSFTCRNDMVAGNLELPGDEDAEEDATTCAISRVGWIVCPIANFLANAADGAYSIVAALLEVQPLTTTGTGEPIYQAWSIMRNIANVVFAIVFLIIIFSQITSIGVSNYGIKRMLPRLIIAAILVNVSYWICAIAVDISNILGYSLKQLFENIGAGFNAPSFGGGETGGTGFWANWAAPLLAGIVLVGAALYVGLSAFLPIIVTVVFALTITFLVLALRQALIILLIVISPLAFVAFLLPNTQQLFSKWRNLFQTLLIIFPIISLIFGASALASQVVTASASNIEDDRQRVAVQLAGAGMSVLPLLAILFLGKFLGRINGYINDPTRGIVDRSRKRAEGVRERQQQRRGIRALGGGRVFGGRGIRRRARREAIRGGLEAESKRAQSAYVADQAKEDSRFRNRLAGGLATGPNASPEALNRAMASAISAQAKIEADEVTAASAIIKNVNLDQDEMQKVALGGEVKGVNGASLAMRAAAIKNVVDTHDVTGVNKLLDDLPNMNAKTREAFADSLQSSSERPQYVSQGVIADAIRQGNVPPLDTNSQGQKLSISQQLAVNSVNNNTWSPQKIATGDKEELKYMAEIVDDQNISDTLMDRTQIRDNAKTAQTDPRLSGQIGKNRPFVEQIAGGAASPGPQPPNITRIQI